MNTMIRKLSKSTYITWVVFFVSFLLCIFNIGGYAIYILDEAKNSEAAREMWETGNYVVPTFNNILRTDKPPLHYFFMILGYELFGVNAFGARFFSAVFGAMTITSTFWFVKRLQNLQLAYITFFVLLSALFFVQEFHLAVPDPYLIFFISSGLFCFFTFYQERKWYWLLCFYIAIGLGTLAKGPISIALPGLIVLLFLIFKKELSIPKILKFRPIIGGILILLISVPWFYQAHLATDGAFTQGFFWDHNINRFGNKMEGHGGIFLITWGFVILGLLPFSVLIPQALIIAWKNRKDSDLVLFSWIVSVVFISFFSISSTKLPNYTMPSYPFIGVLIASFLCHVYHKQRLEVIKVPFLILMILSILLPVAGYIALGLEKQLTGIQHYAWFLIIVSIGGIVGYVLYSRNQQKQAFFVLVGSWMVMGMVLFGIVFPKITSQSPTELAKKYIDRDANVIVYQRLDAAFPINFDRTFLVVQTWEEVRGFLRKHPNGWVLTNKRGVKKELTKQSDLSLEIILDQKAVFENHHTLLMRRK